MQLRRVSKTYFSTTVLPIVVTILLIVGHVAGGTDNEKEDQKIDTFFNIYRHLISRYKRDLENFDAPESNQTIYIIRQNPYLTGMKPVSHEEPEKRYVRSPVGFAEPTQSNHIRVPRFVYRRRYMPFSNCIIRGDREIGSAPSSTPNLWDTSLSSLPDSSSSLYRSASSDFNSKMVSRQASFVPIPDRHSDPYDLRPDPLSGNYGPYPGSYSNQAVRAGPVVPNGGTGFVPLPNKQFDPYDIRPDPLSQMQLPDGTFVPYPSQYFTPLEKPGSMLPGRVVTKR